MNEDDSRALELWSPEAPVTIPSTAKEPSDIVQLAVAHFSSREQVAITKGFDNESYEMVATFVWTRAAAAMKKQVASLGMDFIGELLIRGDLDEDSNPVTELTDHEVLSVAEDLGIITTTQALRLRHALQLITHFNSRDVRLSDDEDEMQREEAVSLLKTCVQSILGRPRFESAVKFKRFRDRLISTTLSDDDPDISLIVESPYFFRRAAISVLLASIRTTSGAPLEHSIGNLLVLLPALWSGLRDSEKYQVGHVFAEISASGKKAQTIGLKKALMRVHGFDYVPETLRSNMFLEAARRVIDTHLAFDNFHNEPSAMAVLAGLGSSIPSLAFPKCMEATLAVWLGNRWGHSFGAEVHAAAMLKSLRPSQWEDYLNKYLAFDRTVLEKLIDENKPFRRWQEVLQKFANYDIGAIRNERVKALLLASTPPGSHLAVKRIARSLRASAGSCSKA